MEELTYIFWYLVTAKECCLWDKSHNPFWGLIEIPRRVDSLTSCYNWHDSHALMDYCIQIWQILSLGESYCSFSGWKRRINFRYQLSELVLIVEKQE
jgi:hypothetical protein